MLQYNPTVSGSLTITGSLTVTNGVIGTVSGVDVQIFSSSINQVISGIQSSTESSDARLTFIETFTSSALTRLTNIESKSASVDISITNINSITASNIARLSNLETKSSSVDISISNINQFTASNGNTSLNSKTGSYATTGSNSFYGTQVFSGSVYIANDLIVQGSSSIQYISASSVSIGTNIVQLNTANPSVRFAGLTVIDSGSIGGSGSFLYDSVHDEFVFVHRGNGTNVTSSHFVLGPETYDSLGNETYLTSNIIPKGTGKEHLVDSCIFDNGTTTCIKNNLITTGIACFGNAICGNQIVLSNVGGVISRTGVSATAVYGLLLNTAGGLYFGTEGSSGGTIVTGNPSYYGALSAVCGLGISANNGNSNAITISPNGCVTIGNSAAVGRLTIGSSTSNDNNSLVVSRGVKPTLTAAQGALLVETNSINGNAESMVYMADAHRFLDDTGQNEMMRLTDTTNTATLFSIQSPSGSFEVYNGAIRIPVGTETSKPILGVQGMIRYNTTYNSLEFFDGICWGNITTNPPMADGGTISCANGYKIHTYTSSGIFNVTRPGAAQIMVIAGGGAGGVYAAGGGGGAGGLMYNSSVGLTSKQYCILIGAGGSGAVAYPGSSFSGNNSYFDNFVAIGGGRGGTGWIGQAGASGGSAGGGGGFDGGPGTGTTSGNSGTPGQGNNSGRGRGISSNRGAGGGGGGAGTPGIDATNNGGGAGGNGMVYSINGSATTYAGGGGGADYGGGNAAGGTGGGGNAGAPGGAGTANLGGGGGGSAGAGELSQYGGNGGSGIVIIAYKLQ